MKKENYLEIDTNVMKMKNIFGEPLKSCCHNPITGYYRDGYCRTDKSDLGRHVVCAIVTKEFLNFSKERGNDLLMSTYRILLSHLTLTPWVIYLMYKDLI